MDRAVRAVTAALLCAALCISLSLSGLAASPGDVTGDDAITAADARVLLRAAVGLETLSDEQRAAADLDLDGAVTAADARIALRAAVGLELAPETLSGSLYDALRGETCYVKLRVSDVEDLTVEYARAKGEKWFAFSVGGLRLSLVMDGDDVLLLDEDRRLYADFAEVQEMIETVGGGDAADDFSADDIMRLAETYFGDALRPLGEADYVQETEFDGKPCTAYIFFTEDGTQKLLMDGGRPVAMLRLNKLGRVQSTVRFDTVSAFVPAAPFEAKKSFTWVEDPSEILLPQLAALVEDGV